MPDELIGSTDERIAFLAGKVEREGLQVPFDVIEYLAERCSTHQALKAAFGSIHSHALLQRVPIDMTLARRIVEGIEPEAEADDSGSANAPEPEPEPALEPAPEPEPATEPEPEPEPLVTEEPEPVLVSPHDVVQPQRIEAPTLFPPEPHTVAAPASAQPARTPSTVWFVPVRTAKKKSLVKRVGSLVKRAGLENVVAEDDLVAIKLHFGEEGNTGFVHPIFLREIVRRVRSCGGKPFLTDANTLYRGKRANAVDHITCAVRNGFSFSTVNAPVIIADGLDGKDGVDVPITGFKHFDTVRIGAAAVHADALVVVSHFKGHEATGFGGALKNLGMGLGTRSAKQRMHSDLKPQVSAEKCTACKRCVKSCPVHAISIGPDRVAVIDHVVCYGCGECVAACPYGAIGIQWKTEPDAIQEKIVEHCAGALDGKDGKALFISFVNNVSPDCDCWNFSDASIVADIGVLVSTDPVAIDQAALDLVNEAPGLPGSRGEGIAPGQDKFLAITGVDGTLGLAYAERMGLGSRTYELVTVE